MAARTLGKARVQAGGADRASSSLGGRGAGTPGNDAGADRREYIIRKAAERIARHGFAVTSVRQIADDVDILSGSLYHHFATKEEILHEIVKDAVVLLRDETLRIAAADADPETRIVALILLELGELVENYPVHAILYNERKLFRSSPEFADVMAAKKLV